MLTDFEKYQVMSLFEQKKAINLEEAFFLGQLMTLKVSKGSFNNVVEDFVAKKYLKKTDQGYLLTDSGHDFHMKQDAMFAQAARKCCDV